MEERGEKQKNIAWARKLLPEIPESIASIEDAWQAPLKGSEDRGLRIEEKSLHPPSTILPPIVVLIQDAHTNASCQLNQAKLFDILFTEGIKGNLLHPPSTILHPIVFTEAAKGSVSLAFLRDKAPLSKRRQIAKEYLQKGLLHGIEYLDLTSDHDFKVEGVEDPDLYFQSLQTYKDSVIKRDSFERYLGEIESTIHALKPKLLNPFLSLFLEKKDKQKDDLVGFIETLSAQADSLNISLSKYPHLRRLKHLKSLESKIDFKEASLEQQKALQSLSPEDQMELSALSVSKLSLKDAQRGFFLLLEEKLKPQIKAYPNLSRYFSYLDRSKALSPKDILKEQKALESEVLKALTTNADEEKLLLAIQTLAYYKKLFYLSLTPEEYQDSKNQKFTDLKVLSGFLNEKLMHLKDHYDKAIFLKEDFTDIQNLCTQFYELTYQRDRAFISNMLKAMPANTSAKPVVLITGGYHTPNLKYLLRQQNISYISIVPQVTHETNTKRYEEILLSQPINVVNPLNVSAAANMNMTGFVGARLGTIPGPVGSEGFFKDLGVQPGEVSERPEGARLATLTKEEAITRIYHYLDNLKKLKGSKVIRLNKAQKIDLIATGLIRPTYGTYQKSYPGADGENLKEVFVLGAGRNITSMHLVELGRDDKGIYVQYEYTQQGSDEVKPLTAYWDEAKRTYVPETVQAKQKALTELQGYLKSLRTSQEDKIIDLSGGKSIDMIASGLVQKSDDKYSSDFPRPDGKRLETDWNIGIGRNFTSVKLVKLGKNIRGIYLTYEYTKMGSDKIETLTVYWDSKNKRYLKPGMMEVRQKKEKALKTLQNYIALLRSTPKDQVLTLVGDQRIGLIAEELIYTSENKYKKVFPGGDGKPLKLGWTTGIGKNPTSMTIVRLGQRSQSIFLVYEYTQHGSDKVETAIVNWNQAERRYVNSSAEQDRLKKHADLDLLRGYLLHLRRTRKNLEIELIGDQRIDLIAAGLIQVSDGSYQRGYPRPDGSPSKDRKKVGTGGNLTSMLLIGYGRDDQGIYIQYEYTQKGSDEIKKLTAYWDEDKRTYVSESTQTKQKVLTELRGYFESLRKEKKDKVIDLSGGQSIDLITSGLVVSVNGLYKVNFPGIDGERLENAWSIGTGNHLDSMKLVALGKNINGIYLVYEYTRVGSDELQTLTVYWDQNTRRYLSLEDVIANDIDTIIENYNLSEIIFDLSDNPDILLTTLLATRELSPEIARYIVAQSFRGLRGASLQVADYDDFDINDDTFPVMTVQNSTGEVLSQDAESVFDTQAHSIIVTGSIQGSYRYIQLAGDRNRLIPVNQDGTFSVKIILQRSRVVNLSFFGVDLKNRQISDRVPLNIRQSQKPKDTDQIIEDLLGVITGVEGSIREDNYQVSILIRRLEVSYLKYFTEDEEEGFRVLANKIAQCNGSPLGRILKNIETKFRQINRLHVPGFKKEEHLFFYQKYAIHEIKRRMKDPKGPPGVVAAIGTGLGKSVIFLSVVRDHKSGSIIVTPNAVTTSIGEQSNFFDEPKTHVVRGNDSRQKTKDLRNARIQNPSHAQVVNTEFLREKAGIESEKSPKFRALNADPEQIVVLDESQSFLGASQQAEGAMKLQRSFTILSSATPATRTEDVRAVLNLLNESKAFQDDKTFRKLLNSRDPADLKLLYFILQSYVISIRIQDVFAEFDPNLPLERQSRRLPKREVVAPDVLGEYTLTDDQAEAILRSIVDFDSFKAELSKVGVTTEDDRELKRKRGADFFSRYHSVVQLENDPAYIGSSAPNPKLEVMNTIIDKETKLPNGKVIIFTSYKEQVRLYEKQYEGLGAVTYYGDTGQGITDTNGYLIDREGRQKLFKMENENEYIVGEDGKPVEDKNGHPIKAQDYNRYLFQNDPQTKVMILTYKSGNVGLTLTAATAVIHDTLPQDYGTFYQADSRAPRIDDKRKKYQVRYYTLIPKYSDHFLEKVEASSIVVRQEVNDQGELNRRSELMSNQNAEKYRGQDDVVDILPVYETYFSQGTVTGHQFEILKTLERSFELIWYGIQREEDLELVGLRSLGEVFPNLKGIKGSSLDAPENSGARMASLRDLVNGALTDINPNFTIGTSEVDLADDPLWDSIIVNPTDANLFKNAMVNLIDNGLDHKTSGNVGIKIINNSKQKGAVDIFLTNQGSIPWEFLRKKAIDLATHRRIYKGKHDGIEYLYDKHSAYIPVQPGDEPIETKIIENMDLRDLKLLRIIGLSDKPYASGRGMGMFLTTKMIEERLGAKLELIEEASQITFVIRGLKVTAAKLAEIQGSSLSSAASEVEGAELAENKNLDGSRMANTLQQLVSVLYDAWITSPEDQDRIEIDYGGLKNTFLTDDDSVLDRIDDIFSELLLNALDHSKKEDHIQLRFARDSNGFLDIEVTNPGTIPWEDLRHAALALARDNKLFKNSTGEIGTQAYLVDRAELENSVVDWTQFSRVTESEVTELAGTKQTIYIRGLSSGKRLGDAYGGVGVGIKEVALDAKALDAQFGFREDIDREQVVFFVHGINLDFKPHAAHMGARLATDWINVPNDARRKIETLLGEAEIKREFESALLDGEKLTFIQKPDPSSVGIGIVRIDASSEARYAELAGQTVARGYAVVFGAQWPTHDMDVLRKDLSHEGGHVALEASGVHLVEFYRQVTNFMEERTATPVRKELAERIMQALFDMEVINFQIARGWNKSAQLYLDNAINPTESDEFIQENIPYKDNLIFVLYYLGSYLISVPLLEQREPGNRQAIRDRIDSNKVYKALLSDQMRKGIQQIVDDLIIPELPQAAWRRSAHNFLGLTNKLAVRLNTLFSGARLSSATTGSVNSAARLASEKSNFIPTPIHAFIKELSVLEKTWTHDRWLEESTNASEIDIFDDFAKDSNLLMHGFGDDGWRKIVSVILHGQIKKMTQAELAAMAFEVDDSFTGHNVFAGDYGEQLSDNFLYGPDWAFISPSIKRVYDAKGTHEDISLDKIQFFVVNDPAKKELISKALRLARNKKWLGKKTKLPPVLTYAELETYHPEKSGARLTTTRNDGEEARRQSQLGFKAQKSFWQRTGRVVSYVVWAFPMMFYASIGLTFFVSWLLDAAPLSQAILMVGFSVVMSLIWNHLFIEKRTEHWLSDRGIVFLERDGNRIGNATTVYKKIVFQKVARGLEKVILFILNKGNLSFLDPDSPNFDILRWYSINYKPSFLFEWEILNLSGITITGKHFQEWIRDNIQSTFPDFSYEDFISADEVMGPEHIQSLMLAINDQIFVPHGYVVFFGAGDGKKVSIGKIESSEPRTTPARREVQIHRVRPLEGPMSFGVHGYANSYGHVFIIKEVAQESLANDAQILEKILESRSYDNFSNKLKVFAKFMAGQGDLAAEIEDNTILEELSHGDTFAYVKSVLGYPTQFIRSENKDRDRDAMVHALLKPNSYVLNAYNNLVNDSAAQDGFFGGVLEMEGRLKASIFSRNPAMLLVKRSEDDGTELIALMLTRLSFFIAVNNRYPATLEEANEWFEKYIANGLEDFDRLNADMSRVAAIAYEQQFYGTDKRESDISGARLAESDQTLKAPRKKIPWYLVLLAGSLLFMGIYRFTLMSPNQKLDETRAVDKVLRWLPNSPLTPISDELIYDKHVRAVIELAKQDTLKRYKDQGLKAEEIRTRVNDNGVFIEVWIPSTSLPGELFLYYFVLEYEITYEATSEKPGYLRVTKVLRIPEDPEEVKKIAALLVNELNSPNPNAKLEALKEIHGLRLMDNVSAAVLVRAIENIEPKAQERALRALLEEDVMKSLDGPAKGKLLKVWWGESWKTGPGGARLAGATRRMVYDLRLPSNVITEGIDAEKRDWVLRKLSQMPDTDPAGEVSPLLLTPSTHLSKKLRVRPVSGSGVGRFLAGLGLANVLRDKRGMVFKPTVLWKEATIADRELVVYLDLSTEQAARRSLEEAFMKFQRPTNLILINRDDLKSYQRFRTLAGDVLTGDSFVINSLFLLFLIKAGEAMKYRFSTGNFTDAVPRPINLNFDYYRNLQGSAAYHEGVLIGAGQMGQFNIFFNDLVSLIKYTHDNAPDDLRQSFEPYLRWAEDDPDGFRAAVKLVEEFNGIIFSKLALKDPLLLDIIKHEGLHRNLKNHREALAHQFDDLLKIEEFKRHLKMMFQGTEYEVDVDLLSRDLAEEFWTQMHFPTPEIKEREGYALMAGMLKNLSSKDSQLKRTMNRIDRDAENSRESSMHFLRVLEEYRTHHDSSPVPAAARLAESSLQARLKTAAESFLRGKGLPMSPTSLEERSAGILLLGETQAYFPINEDARNIGQAVSAALNNEVKTAASARDRVVLLYPSYTGYPTVAAIGEFIKIQKAWKDVGNAHPLHLGALSLEGQIRLFELKSESDDTAVGLLDKESENSFARSVLTKILKNEPDLMKLNRAANINSLKYSWPTLEANSTWTEKLKNVFESRFGNQKSQRMMDYLLNKFNADIQRFISLKFAEPMKPSRSIDNSSLRQAQIKFNKEGIQQRLDLTAMENEFYPVVLRGVHYASEMGAESIVEALFNPGTAEGLTLPWPVFSDLSKTKEKTAGALTAEALADAIKEKTQQAVRNSLITSDEGESFRQFLSEFIPEFFSKNKRIPAYRLISDAWTSGKKEFRYAAQVRDLQNRYSELEISDLTQTEPLVSDTRSLLVEDLSDGQRVTLKKLVDDLESILILQKEEQDAARINLKKQEEAAAKAKIENHEADLKKYLENPIPIQEAAAFLLAEPEFSAFIKSNRVVQQFLEEVAALGNAAPADKISKYLASKQANQVIGPDRRLIEALEIMVKKLTGARLASHVPSRGQKKLGQVTKEWERVLRRIEEINAIRRAQQKEPIRLRVTLANFFHGEGEHLNLRALTESELNNLFQGVFAASLELPPQAVKRFARSASESVVAQKNKFWEKILSVATKQIPSSPEEGRPLLFGVDASSEVRYAMHRMFNEFTAGDFEEASQKTKKIRLDGKIPLRTIGVDTDEEISAEMLFERLPLNQSQRDELSKNKILWVDAKDNPINSEPLVLYYSPDPSFGEAIEQIKKRYDGDFKDLGLDEEEINTFIVSRYLTQVLLALRDAVQGEMMGQNFFKILRDADPLALPSELRLVHVGGALHYRSLRAGLEKTGVFQDSNDSLIQIDRVSDDPRTAIPEDMKGSDFLVSQTMDILDHTEVIQHELRLADVKYFVELFEDFLKAEHAALAPIFFEKAVWRIENGNIDEAETLLNRGLEFDPQSFGGWAVLGSVYGSQERFMEAITAYEKAVEIDPQASEPILLYIGQTYEYLSSETEDEAEAEKHSESARDAYQRALQINPKSQSALDALVSPKSGARLAVIAEPSVMTTQAISYTQAEESEFVTFVARVIREQNRAGDMMVDDTLLQVVLDAQGRYWLKGLGMPRVINPKNIISTQTDLTGEKVEVKLSMSDYTMMLGEADRSVDKFFEGLPETLTHTKVVEAFDLNILPQKAFGSQLTYLLRRYIMEKKQDLHFVVLLRGDPEKVVLAMAEVNRILGEGQKLFLTSPSDLPQDFLDAMDNVRVVSIDGLNKKGQLITPELAKIGKADVRHFIMKVLGEEDFMHPAIHRVARLEARIPELTPDRTGYFERFMNAYETLLGHKIDNSEEFIAALKGNAIPNLSHYALPALLRVEVEKILRLLSLAARMAEQSA